MSPQVQGLAVLLKIGPSDHSLRTSSTSSSNAHLQGTYKNKIIGLPIDMERFHIHGLPYHIGGHLIRLYFTRKKSLVNYACIHVGHALVSRADPPPSTNFSPRISLLQLFIEMYHFFLSTDNIRNTIWSLPKWPVKESHLALSAIPPPPVGRCFIPVQHSNSASFVACASIRTYSTSARRRTWVWRLLWCGKFVVNQQCVCFVVSWTFHILSCLQRGQQWVDAQWRLHPYTHAGTTGRSECGV